MPNCARLSNDPSSTELIDDIMRTALTGVFEDLKRFDWYIREREIVNLFAFGHMVQLFNDHGLDPTMMGIEFPVLQADGLGVNHGSPKDFVIWPESYTTLWKGCVLRSGMDLKQLRGPGVKPFAIVEWKNISRISSPDRVRGAYREHSKDKEWLGHNVNRGMLTIGYAVLTEWDCTETTLRCHRIALGCDDEFLSLTTAISEQVV